MNKSKAVETKNKVATIYGGLTAVFIVIFGGISVLFWFVSTLNF